MPADNPNERPLKSDLAPEDIERLFREHNDSLLRFLRAKLRSAQEAREVAQEAYVKLLGLDGGTAVNLQQAYLFQTAANLAHNRLRDRERRRELDGLVFFEPEVARSPEHSCAAQIDLEVVRQALEGLPAKCRQAFILVKFEDLDFEQAARRMGLKHRQVRRYVTYAIEHCQRALSMAQLRQGGEK